MNKTGKNLAGSYIHSLLLAVLVFAVLLNVPLKKFVINLRTGIYHRLECEYAQKINPRHRRFESNLDVIIKQKFRPCKVCNPPAR